MLSIKDIEAEIDSLESKRAKELASRDRAVQAILQCDGALMLARHLLGKCAEQAASQSDAQPVNRLNGKPLEAPAP